MLIPVCLADGKKEVPSRVQLLKVGNFFAEDGKEIPISVELLNSFKKNFDAKVRGYQDGKLPVDYFHENEKIAGGWIETLELAEGGQELWANVVWTPKATQMLADGELRYISAEFHFNYRHNEGGKRYGPTLFGAGLTNRPFVKGMNPVVNLSEGENTMTLEQAMQKIKELESQIESMKGDKGKLEVEMGDTKKLLAETTTKLAEEKSGREADKKIAEKTGQFNKMLAEGKVCEAQRVPFMSDDTLKFAELAQPLNTSGRGSSQEGDESDKTKKTDSKTPASDKLMELAEKRVKEKGEKLGDAMSVILHEDAELNAAYVKETSVTG
jgi:phage I-like protein